MGTPHRGDRYGFPHTATKCSRRHARGGHAIPVSTVPHAFKIHSPIHGPSEWLAFRREGGVWVSSCYGYSKDPRNSGTLNRGCQAPVETVEAPPRKNTTPWPRVIELTPQCAWLVLIQKRSPTNTFSTALVYEPGARGKEALFLASQRPFVARLPFLISNSLQGLSFSSNAPPTSRAYTTQIGTFCEPRLPKRLSA